MANYVTNRVKFITRGEEILEKVMTDGNFDFEKIIPTPKTLLVTSGSITDFTIAYAYNKKNGEEQAEIRRKLEEKYLKYSNLEKSEKYYLEYLEEELNTKDGELIPLKDFGIKSLEELGNFYINNIIRYGYPTWYEWRCENWGTKWNAFDTRILSNNEIEFQMAWSCPEEIFKALSNMYEGVEIIVDYADEDIGNNCGRICFLNGEVEEYINKEGDIDFALELRGISREEYNEWNGYEE